MLASRQPALGISPRIMLTQLAKRSGSGGKNASSVSRLPRRFTYNVSSSSFLLLTAPPAGWGEETRS